MTLVDTTFLIDLQKGDRNPFRQAAEHWLEEHIHEELRIPAIVFGEFAEGFEDPTHPLLARYRLGYQIVSADVAVAQTYGQLSRRLRLSGENIGSNDTWIAATAVSHGYALLTRNVNHFRRIAELTLSEYC
ncbi:MAG: putative nucleic acid-binding protein [Verrucomicrobiales bacterium]|jgi:predicted nucleic acid-binding protein